MKSVQTFQLTTVNFAITLDQSNQNLQITLRDICIWCGHWKLSIQPDKCHVINLSRHKGDCDFQCTINNELIEWVNKIKFLGFYFARRGWLKTHVEYVHKRAFPSINILKALANKTYDARSLHLTTLMTASTSCSIDYGASVLSTAGISFFAN